ncbi:hypothetical protein ACEPPN_005887, partial [Leptodophora sp. 'Broadleaf-Isolate-01']
MSKSISELDCMTRHPPPVDHERANRLATVAFCGLAVEDREQNRSLSQREIVDRRSFVTSVTRLGLFEANGKPKKSVWSFGDGVKLTLLGTGQTQSHVWKAPASLLEGLLK